MDILKMIWPTVLVACVLPWPVLVRVTLAFSVWIALEWCTAPPVHWSDEGVFYAFALVVLALGCMAWLTVLALKGVVRVFRKKPILLSFWYMDMVLAAGVAAVLTLIVFVRLGWLAQSSNAPLLVHIGCGAFAFGLFWTAWKQRELLVRASFFLAASVSLAALTVWSGVVHPNNVLRAAEIAADGRLYCIALQTRKRAAQRRDLTFLAMDKRTFPRHALLVIKGVPETKAPHWSYHRAKFLERGGPLGSWRCDPSE